MSRIQPTDDTTFRSTDQVSSHAAATDQTGDQTGTTGRATVEVRRNGRLAVVLGLLFGGLALAFFLRGQGTLDWVLGGVLAVLAVGWAWVASDARTPLLVADDHGIRIRLGRVWNGMPWSELDEVEHLPRRGALRDGRLLLLPRDAQAQDAAIPKAARRRAGVSRKLYGVSFAVPLGMTTLVPGGSRDLTERLAVLAGDRTTIVEIDPSLVDDTDAEADAEADAAIGTEADAETDMDVDTDTVMDAGVDIAADTETDTETDADAGADPQVAARDEEADGQVADPRPGLGAPAATHTPAGPATSAGPGRGAAPPPVTASDHPAAGTAQPPREATRPVAGPRILPTATPAPRREPVDAVRTQIVHDQPSSSAATYGATALQPELTSSVVSAPGVTPIARPGEAVEPLVIDDPDLEPAPEPVIGPQLAAARTRLGLSVDQLAERTRIRPHVIESIEVDDFAPCGGDFYARGHLRTLARVLGIESAPLLESYDATYADAPLDPRAVFEAELATGSSGTIRRMRGGPNWSVLIAAVMAVVLLWSVARLVMDDSRPSAPDVAGLAGDSQGVTNPYGQTAAPVPVSVTAAGGGANVVVRDGGGDVVFSGDLAFGQTKNLKASPPVRVQSSDGSVEVSVNGADAAAIGATGEEAQKTYTAR